MIDSDFRPLSALDGASVPQVAFVPNELGGRYAGYLYLWPARRVRFSASRASSGAWTTRSLTRASAEALIGGPIGPWELRTDGWYAEIQYSPVYRKDLDRI